MTTLKEILTRRPVAATIRLTVPAGGARPAPPVGPALGQYRLNLMAFCKDFNARTQKYKPDTPMSVTITAFKDNTFEFTVKSPSVTCISKKLRASTLEAATLAMSSPPRCPSDIFTRLPRLSNPIPIVNTCPLRVFASPLLGLLIPWGLKWSKTWIKIFQFAL
ncbi:hypothetical protein REPUB_Repub09cG0207500 [Reevesia pubescens]